MNPASAALPPVEIATRADRLRIAARAVQLDALVITDLTNVRWLTGFTGSAGRVVLTADRLVVIVDGRYGDQARRQLGAAGVIGEVVIGLSGAELLDLLAAATAGLPAVGFESEHLTVAEHARLMAALGRPLVATAGVVEELRRAKDDGEIARIERAAAIASEALAAVLSVLEHGPTERHLARQLDRAMEDLGAAGPSFETILASGPNSGRPHARPSDRRIVEGDAVVFDFGALYDGYHSDMTRTLLLGSVDPWIAEGYAAVEAAQAAGVAAVRAGRPAVEVDAACRQVLLDAGFGQFFTHGTGHGVGLLIHESPWLRQQPGDVLTERDVVTVEPGVYRGELGGIRIEDTVVVTADGCRSLTLTPKDLSCLRSPRTTSRPE
jgi:Xaa-Pro aminopeptidase